jgi:hypothetical protein
VHDKIVESMLDKEEQDESWIEETDASGLPWDARIHAKNKAKTASGMWKLGRNIPNSLVKSVTKQLRSATVDAVTTLAPKPSALPKPPMPLPPLPIAPPMPVPPARKPASQSGWLDVPTPPTPPIAAPAVVEEEDAFGDLQDRIMDGIHSNKFTSQQILTIVRGFKDVAGNTITNTLGGCAKYPELLPRIHAELDKISA